MGLDGISINQLRSVPERTSGELNSNVAFSLNINTKAIDGLSNGQRVDPDKQKEHEKRQLKRSFSNPDNQNHEDLEQEHEKPQVIKYDLSKTEKFSLVVDDITNEIMIIEKHTKNIVQKINADELSNFVNFLPGAKGAIINRKF